jgi:segregation and condensation protein A
MMMSNAESIRAGAQFAASDSPFSIQIGAFYDGPFDLLLDLIRKQQIDIYDIPIARITAQYLNYLETLKELDVEIAGDFLLMAATLIQIKSRLLLPPDPTLPGETPVDPREELVQRLLEYEKYKKAAEMLHQKQQLEDASWTQPGSGEFKNDIAAEPELAVGIYDLMNAFQQVLQRLKDRPRLDIAREEVSVAEMMQHLRRLLLLSDEPLKLRALFETAQNRRVLVATFLAVLEMVRLQAIELRQERSFGEILIRKHRLFDTVFESIDASALDAPRRSREEAGQQYDRVRVGEEPANPYEF